MVCVAWMYYMKQIHWFFYSGCCGKIRYDYMQEIKCSGCRFKVVKLKEAGKNALDFYIVSECGVLSERG